MNARSALQRASLPSIRIADVSGDERPQSVLKSARLRPQALSEVDAEEERRELETQLKKVMARCANYERQITTHEVLTPLLLFLAHPEDVQHNIEHCLVTWAERLRELRNCDNQAEALDRRIGLSRTRLNADVTTAVQQAREALKEGEGRLEGGLKKLETAVNSVKVLREELIKLEKQFLAEQAEREERRRLRRGSLIFSISCCVLLIAMLWALLSRLL